MFGRGQRRAFEGGGGGGVFLDPPFAKKRVNFWSDLLGLYCFCLKPPPQKSSAEKWNHLIEDHEPIHSRRQRAVRDCESATTMRNRRLSSHSEISMSPPNRVSLEALRKTSDGDLNAASN